MINNISNDVITFVTGNENKYKELQHYCGIKFDRVKLDLTEIQDLSLENIAIAKAKEAYFILKQPVLIEDAAFVINHLNNLPGPFIKWFLEDLSLQEICNLAPKDKREAVSQVVYVLFDGKQINSFKGETKGLVANEPKGQGFGWNPIFIPNGETLTWGEMSLEQRELTSMRKKALTKLDYFLKSDR